MSAAPSAPAPGPVTLRARPDVIARSVRFGSATGWVLKDPLALRYFHLGEHEYFIFRRLATAASLEELAREFTRRFTPQRISLARLQHFIGSLHRQGLLISTAAGQADVLLRRRDRLKQAERWSRLLNPLVIRWRGVNPQSSLDRLLPRVRWIFTPATAMLAISLTLIAMSAMLSRTDELLRRWPTASDFFTPGNLFWLAATIGAVKVLHELGHAIACRHFGAECHELGFMLLCFAPCLYCNVTDSWLLPSRTQRILIAAAGMMVEIVLASLAAIAWCFAPPGLWSSILLNVMIVCSIGTLFINGNPLLRYDGYFILADWLGIPNLGEQASEAWRALLRRWFTGQDESGAVKVPGRRRAALAAYAAASAVYRLFIVFTLLWFVQRALAPHGLTIVARLIALVVVAGIAVSPALRFARWLRRPTSVPEQERSRVLRRAGVAAGALLALLFIPLPARVVAPALVEPRDAETVYVAEAGRLTETTALNSIVSKGQQLARLENRELELEVERLRGLRDAQRLYVDQLELRRVNEPELAQQRPGALQTLADLEEQLAVRSRDLRRLTLISPREGCVIAPSAWARLPDDVSATPRELDALQPTALGATLTTGTVFCRVGDPRAVELLLVVDEAAVERVHLGQAVTAWLDSLATPVSGVVVEISERDVAELSPGLAASNLLAMRRDGARGDPSTNDAPAETLYEIRMTLDANDVEPVIGATGWAKIHIAPQSLAARAGRWLSGLWQFRPASFVATE